MDNKIEFKKINIKNDDIMEIDDINVDKLHQAINQAKILQFKHFIQKIMNAKPLRVRFNKVDL